MEWIGPTDARYDEQRALFNAMIDKRPRVIAACETPADIRSALDRAREDGLEVAVRSGWPRRGRAVHQRRRPGHRRPGHDEHRNRCDRPTARVGGGCTWADFDAAAQQHGLATTGGRVSTTGVAGLTLGGGSGWLERRHGLACDNLVALELVTADGREIRADDTQHQDLLWASKGGGGTSASSRRSSSRCTRSDRPSSADCMAWPADAADEVARAYRDWAEDAPDELGSGLVMLVGPPEDFIPAHLQNQPMVAIAVMWSGDDAEGAALVQVMRDLEPDLDLVGPMPYVQLQSMIDDPPGLPAVLERGLPRLLPRRGPRRVPRRRPEPHLPADPAPVAALGWCAGQDRRGRHPNGPARRPLGDPPFATWADPADDEINIAWVRAYRASNAPFTTGGVYLNFIGDEGEERINAAFGAAKLERLAAIKAEYDPANVFAGNQNIRPKVPA